MYFLAFAESIQLVPDGSIFIHIGLILLMIWVLNRTFFRPINRLIESREKHMSGDGEAADILRDVNEKESRFDREMRDARSQGYELIEKEHIAAIAAGNEKLGSARTTAAETLTSEKARLEKEAETARAAIAADASTMGDKIASSILRS
ncbi:MAG: hypothetical protein WBD22_07615 [Pyrinomonadaceae bacterium]